MSAGGEGGAPGKVGRGGRGGEELGACGGGEPCTCGLCVWAWGFFGGWVSLCLCLCFRPHFLLLAGSLCPHGASVYVSLQFCHLGTPPTHTHTSLPCLKCGVHASKFLWSPASSCLPSPQGAGSKLRVYVRAG